MRAIVPRMESVVSLTRGVLRQRAAYYGGYRPAAVTSDGGRPHYAVTAYYAGGPWYGYSGWDDYAARNSIKCKPGGTVKLDDGQMYVCQ
jgi:hypothetical protein